MGAIGIPTATMFALSGCMVTGVDIKEEHIAKLCEGKYKIMEPDLDEAFRQVIHNGHLALSAVPVPADAFIITVPTPLTKEKKPDLSYVEAACNSILPCLRIGNLVVLESTSPVGTLGRLVCPILEKSGYKPGVDIHAAYSPERVIPGNILNELVNNDRLAGGINIKSACAAKELYSIFVRGEIHITDAATAELCKLAENTYRDINIAYSNELLKICENTGLNVWEVRKLCNMHPRVNIHMPGPGVGGHCVAVDPWFLVDDYPACTDLIKTARILNDGMPQFVADKVTDILSDIRGVKKVTVMGISYKADVDDIRESSTLYLAELLSKHKDYIVSIYDPVAVRQGNPEWNDMDNAFKDSDMLILGVAHKVFSELDFAYIKKILRHPRILDTRNVLDKTALTNLGFTCYLMGNAGGFK